MEPELVVEMKRQITNKVAKTGLDLAQAYNDMPTGSSVGKSIKVGTPYYDDCSIVNLSMHHHYCSV